MDITVTNRSNDAVYGCYGANAYHMSVLQEYLAARIGVEVGTYTQFSNNLHMYEWSADRANHTAALDSRYDISESGYPGVRPLVDHPESFDEELRFFLENPLESAARLKNSHFSAVAQPMLLANLARKDRAWPKAMEHAESIQAPDLRRATVEWLRRRETASADKRETRE